MLASVRVVAGLAFAAVTVRAVAQAGSKPIAIIGGDQDRAAALENPAHIAAIGGKILVLDAHQPYLKLFSFEGKPLQQFVKKGAGPGEIGAAYRFMFDSAASRLYVWDVMNLRANIYLLRDTLTFETSWRMQTAAVDGCLIGSRVFVVSVFRDHLIHEMERQGGELRLLRSFAVSRANQPLDANRMYQHQVAMGPVVCDAAGQRIVAVSGYGGVAQFVDVRTTAQRTVALDSLKPLKFWEQPAGNHAALSQMLGPDGVDWVKSAQPMGDGVRFLADYLARGHSGNEDFASVSEWFLSSEGVMRRIATTRQREVGRLGASVACFVGSPVPTIEIYHAARCP